MKIKIKYIWSKELALSSARALYEYEFKNSRKRFIGWFFIALVQFGVVGALKHNSYGFLTLGTIGLVYWYGLRWPLRKYFIEKTFEKSPLANSNIDLLIKDDGIYKEDELQISLEDIKKIIQLEDGVLVYYFGGNLYFPNDAFTNRKDREKFVNIKLDVEEIKEDETA